MVAWISKWDRIGCLIFSLSVEAGALWLLIDGFNYYTAENYNAGKVTMHEMAEFNFHAPFLIFLVLFFLPFIYYSIKLLWDGEYDYWEYRDG